MDNEYAAREPRNGDARAVRLVATHWGRSLCSAIEADEERDYISLLEGFDPETRTGIRQAVGALCSALCAGCNIIALRLVSEQELVF